LKDLTLRDYFAALAMQGMLAYGSYELNEERKVAEWAYRQADAMLKEKNKGPI
jgi:hypothetical protein